MAATRVRRVILTGSVVVASISGALYGASLKMNQEAKQVSELIPSTLLLNGPLLMCAALLMCRKLKYVDLPRPKRKSMRCWV